MPNHPTGTDYSRFKYYNASVTTVLAGSPSRAISVTIITWLEK